MFINKNSHIPIYYQLKQDIIDRINKKEWTENQCISSERELSEHYSVSRMTVRQAIGELVQQGVLIREKGKGTFVCGSKLKQQDIMSFTDMAVNQGLQVKSKVVECLLIDTPIELQQYIFSDKVYKFSRLRFIDDEIIGYELVFVPEQYSGIINEEKLKDSFYKLLNENGYEVHHCEAGIQSLLMDEYYKDLFKAEIELPLLKIDSKNYDKYDSLLFIEQSVYRSDKYMLEVNLFKKEGKIL